MVPRSLIFLISILYSSAFMHHQQKISRTSTKLSKYPVTKKLKSSNDFEGYAIDQSGGSSSYERKPSLSANSTSSNSYPSRQDTCIMLFSGVIGTQPKETYLKQGNYVIRFSIAIQGHYKPLFESEKEKVKETVWLTCEIWDEKARESFLSGYLQKGKYVRGVGNLIVSKWIDKNDGEEKSKNILRINKILLSDEEFQNIPNMFAS